MTGVEKKSYNVQRTAYNVVRNRNSRFAKGFTVVELLVVMVLFSISITILTQTYITFIRLSHRTGNAATLQQDMRFTFEYMTRNLRNIPIDYPALPKTLDNTTSTLRLKDPSQTDAWILTKTLAGDARCGDAPDVSCLVVSTDGGFNWAPVTSKHVNVETFKVLIRPMATPFALSGNDYTSDQQPFVTVQMRLSYITKVEKEKVNLTAQTTISSRVYVR
ncbi:MAG: prepilin-type N-terminal cleavage/methylation domain-containing protein [Patescibacteria group bacterium]|nr:prepilin-type N-terminal cleavage/methylation domain-containing protein [Patescibacteria group bacterium]